MKTTLHNIAQSYPFALDIEPAPASQTPPLIDTITHVLNERLFPYQQAWMRDQSRFKIGLWARQTGKDFTCAAEAVVDAVLHPATQWLIIACAERQAMESLQKVKEWADQFGVETEGNLSQVRFENGSRIIALPARPASIRGYSANLILTEFAFHDDPEAVWRAAFPIITNPGAGREKKVRIISTPNGQANLFHRLWSGSAYSKHFVNIHEAIAQGLPLNAEELQSGLGDAEAWQQEYECQFIDSSSVLLPYELLRSAQSAEATHMNDLQTLSAQTGRMYMGVAFEPNGKRVICWTLEALKESSQYLTREILVLEGKSIPVITEALLPRLRVAVNTWFDATGVGSVIARKLARHARVQQQPLTPALQNEIYPELQAALQHNRLILPQHSGIEEQLHAIQATVTETRQIQYHATQGAAPEYLAALALATHAAMLDDPSQTTAATSFEVSYGWGGPRTFRPERYRSY
jgi:phage FluMu gp28-like protein